MDLYGLIGKKLAHSFSPSYFHEKFNQKNIAATYKLFEIEYINLFPDLLSKYQDLKGFNITIPYKKEIIKFIDHLSDEARLTNSVNTVRVEHVDGKLVLYGYNTDIKGIEKTLVPFVKSPGSLRAVILGTGGSARSVSYVLDKLGVEHLFVSRNPNSDNQIGYDAVDESFLNKNHLIINATPVGMYPLVANHPAIPYEFISSNHILFDLIYNPSETVFLKKGKKAGATILNGLKMLTIQADEAWEIWQK